jgi:3-hydroxybutyryl-CoA dehydrogenase
MGEHVVEVESIIKIAILGTGSMGIDLGLLSALHGFDVILWHRRDSQVAHDRLMIRIEKYLAKGILTETDRETALGRIHITSRLEELSVSDLVIETIAEDFGQKSQLLNRVGCVISDKCILVSNTSSLSIEALATCSGVPLRFAGLHFFNPALKMQLVEIVASSKTSAETLVALKAVVDQMGKTAVQLKDAPGFIVNRLMACQIREAILLVEQGVASPADVDTAVKLGLAHPIGPLALADLIGLDVMLAIFTALFRESNSPSFEPPRLLDKMVSEDLLGRKTGKGFFQY